jgi:transcriptional regulator of acetoin/glycerol metabolism
VDRELRALERTGDSVRGALLAARAGRAEEALDALERLWRGGDEAARDVLLSLVEKTPRRDRLRHAERLDRLAHAGKPEADRLWRSWFVPAARIVGRSAATMRLRSFLYRHARSSGPILLASPVPGVGCGLAARALHDLSGRKALIEVNLSTRADPTVRGEIRHAPRRSTLLFAHAQRGDWEEEALEVARDRGCRILVASDVHSSEWGTSAIDFAACFTPEPLLAHLDEDLPLLCRAILDRNGGARFPVSDELLRALSACSWPGNVRHLEVALGGLMRHVEKDGPLPVHLLEDWLAPYPRPVMSR